MDDEIDLRQYVIVLWKRRRLIMTVTLVAVLAAALLSLAMPPVYEAKALLFVAKSSFQAGAPPESNTPGLKIGAILVSELPAETLVAFAKSESIARKVDREILGPGSDASSPPYRLSAQAIRNTNLVELRVRASDPALAAKVADQWASLVSAESELLYSTEAKGSYAFFDKRLAEARAQLQAAEEALREFSASSRIGVLQARANAATAQIATYESRSIDLSVSLQRAETELAQTEVQIRQQPKTLTLSKSITTDPFLQQLASDATKRDFVELSKLRLRSEELNPVQINLDQSRANLSIQVAALKAERSRVAGALVQLNAELASLQDKLAAQQLRQTQLIRSVENAKQVYDVLLPRREEARVASASQAGSVRLVAGAAVSRFPVAPRKMLNITLAAIFGLMAGGILASVLEYFAPSASVLTPVPVPGSSRAAHPSGK